MTKQQLKEQLINDIKQSSMTELGKVVNIMLVDSARTKRDIEILQNQISKYIQTKSGN